MASAQTSANNHGTIIERLRSSRVELFKGVTKTTLTVTKYWFKVTKWVLDDMKCTLEQKLKGIVSMLHDEAYRWLQDIVRST